MSPEILAQISRKRARSEGSSPDRGRGEPRIASPSSSETASSPDHASSSGSDSHDFDRAESNTTPSEGSGSHESDYAISNAPDDAEATGSEDEDPASDPYRNLHPIAMYRRLSGVSTTDVRLHELSCYRREPDLKSTEFHRDSSVDALDRHEELDDQIMPQLNYVLNPVLYEGSLQRDIVKAMDDLATVREALVHPNPKDMAETMGNGYEMWQSIRADVRNREIEGYVFWHEIASLRKESPGWLRVRSRVDRIRHWLLRMSTKPETTPTKTVCRFEGVAFVRMPGRRFRASVPYPMPLASNMIRDRRGNVELVLGVFNPTKPRPATNPSEITLKNFYSNHEIWRATAKRHGFREILRFDRAFMPKGLKLERIKERERRDGATEDS